MAEERAGFGTGMFRMTRSGVWVLLDYALSQLMTIGLTVALLSVGIAYRADDERVREAVRSVAGSLKRDELAASYEVSADRIEEARAAVLETFPISLAVRGLSTHGFAVGAALFALGFAGLLWRVRRGGTVAGELGRSLATTGAILAVLHLVLEWRAIIVIDDVVREGRPALDDAAADAAMDVLGAVWPALAIAGVAIVAAVVGIRGGRADHSQTPPLVVRRGLLAGAAAVLAHATAAIGMSVLTRGATAGPSVAPVVLAPLAYATSVALFATGASLWVGARRDEAARKKE